MVENAGINTAPNSISSMEQVLKHLMNASLQQQAVTQELTKSMQAAASEPQPSHTPLSEPEHDARCQNIEIG